MTAEVPKYTLEQVEALELAPGTEHAEPRRLGSRAGQRRDLRQALKRPSTIAAT